MTNLSQLLRVCSDTWVQCENLLLQLPEKPFSYSQRTVQVLDECAQMCMGTFYALTHELPSKNKIALLCLGLCEECAEVCERYNDIVFKQCAIACRQCSSLISSVAQTAM